MKKTGTYRHMTQGRIARTITFAAACACVALLQIAKPAMADHNGTDGALDIPGQTDYLEDQLNDNWLPAIPAMADQLTDVMIHQIFGIGALLDAKDELETQRLIDQLRAEAHKNYKGSEQMCRYGTNVRSLAATEMKARSNQLLLGQVMQQRLTLRGGSGSERGRFFDQRSRFDQFRRIYCNPEENNGSLISASIPDSNICITAAGGVRINNDIDFTRMLDTKNTLNIDFTDNTLTDDEQDILALSRNLFSHELLDYKIDSVLARADNFEVITAMRSLHAVRSVAHNSFSHMVGMKARGTGTVGNFMTKVMEELGVPAGEINQMIGNNPSYFAQMEVLTRKMYQNATFYTNLYTSPENLKRTSVALQALQIMHDRDRFEGSLRREMLISMILEMKLREAQDVVVSNIAGNKRSASGDPLPVSP